MQCLQLPGEPFELRKVRLLRNELVVAQSLAICGNVWVHTRRQQRHDAFQQICILVAQREPLDKGRKSSHAIATRNGDGLVSEEVRESSSCSLIEMK